MDSDLSGAFDYRKFVEKAGHKYVKREPLPGGGYRYVYPGDEPKVKAPDSDRGLKRATHRVTWWQGPVGGTVSQNFTSEADAKAHAAKLTAYPKHVRVEAIAGDADDAGAADDIPTPRRPQGLSEEQREHLM